MIRDVEKHVIDGKKYHVYLELKQLKVHTRAEEFGQNYVRSAATSVGKLENSPHAILLHNFALNVLNLKTKNQRIQRKIG